MNDLKEKLLTETAAYYRLGNRAVNGYGGCNFRTKDGNRCAIGRIMTPEGIELFEDKGVLFLGSAILWDVFLEEWKPLVRPENLAFLDKVQWLHDNHLNWTADGLSEQGLKVVENIRAKYISQLDPKQNPES